MNVENELKKIPVLRFLIPFMLGILGRNAFQPQPVIIIYILVTVVGLYLFFLISRNKTFSYHSGWKSGLLANILLILTGFLFQHRETEIPPYIIHHEKLLYMGYVSEIPAPTEKYVKTTVTIDAYKFDNHWFKSKGKAFVYFPNTPSSIPLHLGSKVIFYTRLNQITNPGNPNEFNYQQYIFRKGIYSSAFLNQQDWQSLDHDKHSLILAAKKITQYLLSIYKKYGIEDDEYAVLAALTLGDRTGIDAELKEIYSYSGAMHILSVSGLHIGIIYMVFNYLLGFLNRKRRGKITKVILILVIIWIYAFLTGLPPSVQRAAIMFSFLSIGKAGRRDTNIYNVLAISAFIILIANPSSLFDVGFQLSFIAVAGIVFFQPRIYSVLIPKNKVLRSVWQLLSVSFAAQLVTCPLTLYYFSYFPSYFWLTNIFVIPLVTIITSLAILLFTISFNSILAGGVAWCINLFVKLLNEIIGLITDLPHSTVNNLSITGFETILLYLILVFITLFVILYSKKWLFLTLWSTGILLVIEISIQYHIITHKGFYVYNVRGISVCQIINGQSNLLITSTLKSDDISAILYAIKNNITVYRQKETFYYLAGKSVNNVINSDTNWKLENLKGNIFITAESGRYVILTNDSLLNYSGFYNLPADKIVISKPVNQYPEEMQKVFNTSCIIIDSSVPRWKAEKWMEQCKTENLNCHYAGDTAYMLEI